MSNTTQSSRTTQTEDAYIERAENLLNLFSKENNKASLSDNDYVELAEWLIQRKPNISRATWRYYKSSIIYYLESQIKHSEASNMLKKAGNEGCKDKDVIPLAFKQTSARKKKSITEREETMIIDHLKRLGNKSFWALPTLAFFKATILTGLRPDEWTSVQYIEDEKHAPETMKNTLPILKVKNAKSTNGRSHGEYRHLGLGDLGERELTYIKIQIQYTNIALNKRWMTPTGQAETFAEYYKSIQSCIYRTTRTLFPIAKKRPTIYSCRHQFIADLKHAKYTLEAIAALVGHATDETASEHYGKRRFGRKRSGLPTPNPEEVLKIKQLYQGRIAHDEQPNLRPE